MKQMCGRGKFFMTPGLGPGLARKMPKFDDGRFFYYERGNHYGAPCGPHLPPPPCVRFKSLPGMPFHAAGK